MNKKGYYRFSDIGMFFISFIIISVGIGIGIFLFYSQTIDVRQQEAIILSDKLINALVENGNLRQEVLGDFDIYKEAGLDRKIIVDNGEYYFKIEVFKDGEIVRSPIIEGTRSFDVECFLDGEKFPKCHQRNFFTNEEYSIKILTGSNQLGKRV